MAVLQLDEVNLYSAGTALLEQNLHTLDSLRIFNDKVSSLSYELQIVHGESSFPVCPLSKYEFNAFYCKYSSLVGQ